MNPRHRFASRPRAARAPWLVAAALAVAALLMLALGAHALPLAGLLIGFTIARLASLYRLEARLAVPLAALGVVLAAGVGALLGAAAGGLLVLGGLVVAAAWLTAWAAVGPLRAVTRRAALSCTIALAAAAVSLAPGRPAPLPPTDADAEARPLEFIPLQLDGTGRRLVLFSVHDSDTGEDDETFSLWSLTVADGSTHRVFRGHPYFTVDWCPAGNQLTFCAGDGPLDGTQPLALYAARYDGSNVRRRLVPQQGSWLYPLWSERDDWLGCWLMDGNVTLPFAGPASATPRTYVVPADQGNAAEVKVPGCRLALMGAWQADGVGLYMITENGVWLRPKEGKPRRLIPSGEAPLDPLPFVTPEGVSSAGGIVAYTEMTIKKGAIDRVDLGLVSNQGKPRRVVGNLIPFAHGWSADGQVLVAASNERGRLALTAIEPRAGKARKMLCDVKLGAQQPMAQLFVSRDGRYASVDGLLESDESWTLTVFDLSEGKRVLYASDLALVCGWTPTGRVLISNLRQVVAVSPESGEGTPIYPRAAAAFQAAGGRALHRAYLDRTERQRGLVRAAVALRAR